MNKIILLHENALYLSLYKSMNEYKYNSKH